MFSSLIIKVAFLYVGNSRTMVGQTVIVPTYRVSMVVYPELQRPHFSAAASKVTSDGRILPYVIVKEAEGLEIKTELHKAGKK